MSRGGEEGGRKNDRMESKNKYKPEKVVLCCKTQNIPMERKTADMKCTHVGGWMVVLGRSSQPSKKIDSEKKTLETRGPIDERSA